MSGNQALKAKILQQFKVNESDLKKLCDQMQVRTLSVFGSVTQNEFKSGQSDIDFLVEFETISIDRFFDFLDGLKKIFHYENIDLVTVASLKNHVIREEVLSSQEKIYAA